MKNDDITLERMQELLNGYEPKNEDNDNLHSESDLTQIMNYEGYSIGNSGDSNDILATFDKFKDELLEAKGFYIKFILNIDTTMSVIGDIVEEINSRLNQDVDMILGTEIDNTIGTDIYKYQFIITGLSDLR